MSDGINIQENEDIKKALEEFERKSKEEEMKFKIEESETSEIPRMVRLVMKYSRGYVKDQKTAEYVLLAFVVVAFALSLFLIFGGGDESDKYTIPLGTRIIYPPNAPPRLERY